jgi:hypothetical protein
MKLETITGSIFLKLWLGFVILLLTGYLSNDIKLNTLINCLIYFNIAVYFITSAYALISLMIAVRDRMPVICILITFSATIIMSLMGILDIYWCTKETEQVLVDWLNLLWTMLEFCFAVYVVETVYLVNNLDVIKSPPAQYSELHHPNRRNSDVKTTSPPAPLHGWRGEKTSLEKTSLEETSLDKTSLEKTSLDKTSPPDKIKEIKNNE